MKKFLCLILITTFSSCGALLDSNTELETGYYFQRKDAERKQVYVDITEDEVNIYEVDRTAGKKMVDTLSAFRHYPRETSNTPGDIPALWEHHFDIDFLTIPLKYRFSRAGVPAQLNSELNGAGYFGYRMDRHKLSYNRNEVGHAFLDRTRFGFSFGVFTGVGNTAVNPTTTNGQTELEYDGVVWQKGIAAIAGINNFTLGLTLGFDTLPDSNRDHWLYQHKPWIGLALGLNLN